MDMTNDSKVNGSSKAWHARLRNLGLAAAVALVFSPLALPVADPVAVSAEQVPNPCDFTTSGGYVITNSLKKANFGVHGGCKNGEFWGNLNVVDHATGYHVNSVEVTAYVAPFPTATTYPDAYTRDVCGIAESNDPADGDFVYFRARLVDGGEPGTLDMFGLLIKSETGITRTIGLRALGTARPGGNVQLHDPNPSTIPVPAGGVLAACGGLSFEGSAPE